MKQNLKKILTGTLTAVFVASLFVAPAAAQDTEASITVEFNAKEDAVRQDIEAKIKALREEMNAQLKALRGERTRRLRLMKEQILERYKQSKIKKEASKKKVEDLKRVKK